MSPSKESRNPEVVSILLTDVGKKVFSGIEFTQYPEFKVEKIIEYNSRMRISPLEKFNGPCFISFVNLYESLEDLKAGNALGALVLYVNEELCGKILKKMEFSGFDEDDEDAVVEVIGKLLRKYMENMLISLRSLGYSQLVTGEPNNFVNSVPNGVDFAYSEKDLYSVSFYGWKKKCIVTDLTLAGIIDKKQ